MTSTALRACRNKTQNDQHRKIGQQLKNKNKTYHFSAYFEKLQMQLVLLIILEPTKKMFAETPKSKVHFT